MLKELLDWLDNRTGAVSAVKDFLDEDIPASSGWHQVFGSVALFLLLIQFFTGALLAINYAAQPEAAFYSIQYIMTEVTGGALVRGLHHWGASAMVIIVVIHMVQVAIWGAYKKPREMNWLVGVVLLLMTLGFSLTGYLLPWDNKAYWATVVTVQISSLAPGAGDLMLHLFGSSDGTVGVGTFQRFFALHTMILPAVTLGLAIFHVYLVRRHGVAPAPGDEAKPKKKFYPEQVFRDTVAVFAIFCVVFLLAAFVAVPMESIADPNNKAYIPRPEWYFLFLFQSLKFFEGSLEVIGAIILPTLALLALAAVPFIDRGKLKRAGQRVTAMVVVGLAFIGWAALTGAAIMTTPEQVETADKGPGTHWSAMTAFEVSGYATFKTAECGTCHNLISGEPKAGPALAVLMGRKPGYWVEQHVKSEASGLSGTQVQTLVAFSSQVTPNKVAGLEAASDPVLAGARLYTDQSCGMCHAISGEGAAVGPPLNGVGGRRDPQWLADHFRDPQALVPGSTMPPYDLPDEQMNALVAYMSGL